MQLTITLPIPPSVNHSHLTTRNGKRIMKEETREYKEKAALVARLEANQQGFIPQTSRLALTMTIFAHRNGIDVDNRCKILLDSLADGIGFNDKQIDEIHIYRAAKDKNNPRCEITLRTL